MKVVAATSDDSAPATVGLVAAVLAFLPAILFLPPDFVFGPEVLPWLLPSAIFLNMLAACRLDASNTYIRMISYLSVFAVALNSAAVTLIGIGTVKFDSLPSSIALVIAAATGLTVAAIVTVTAGFTIPRNR